MRRSSPVLIALAALCALLLATAGIARAMEVAATLSQDGTRIEYAAAGTGEPTLVFIHGWNCDRSYWSAQMQHFAADYRVVAADLAGHGASGLGRQDYTMAGFGQDVAAAVTGDSPVILIGHSMGAPVMLEAARLLGDRVLGMVAVDSLHQVTDSVPDSSAIEAQVAPLIADYETTARPFILNMFVEDTDPALRDEITRDMLAANQDVSISAVRGLMAMNYAKVLADLHVPLVLINSTQRPTDMAALNALYPGSRLETMAGVGHFLMMEKPAAFNAILEDVIASMRSR
ncbi:MAG: alpha/beta hydrolase [Chromatocurvus sp.]